MPYALGIDVGTTNLKVALTRDDATVVGAAQRALAVHRGSDTAEQDSSVMWDEVVDAVREVTAAHPAEAAEVVAMAVCSQYSSIVPVNENGLPVAPMLMWQDQRGTDHSWAIMSREESAFTTFLERHGIPPIGSGLSLGHILHYQLDRPDVHARDARLPRGDGLRDGAPHRTDHRVAAHLVHGAALRQPHARRAHLRRRAGAAFRSRRDAPAPSW